MKTTRRYHFKYFLEVDRSILQEGTEYLDDTVHHVIAMFVLSLFSSTSFAYLLIIYQLNLFSGKGSVPPLLSYISVIKV